MRGTGVARCTQTRPLLLTAYWAAVGQGGPDADIKQVKALLAEQIIGTIDDHALSVRKAASLTGFVAADFSRVRNAELGRFSIARLIKMLAALDEGIEVSIQFSLLPAVGAPNADV